MGTAPKVAVVTGGASGIGLLVAKEFARAGSRVAIVDINPEALEKVVDSKEGFIPFLCDLSDEAATRALVADIRSSVGEIDRLVHCAAIMPAGPLVDMGAALTNKVMAVNYMGTVNITQAVLPGMLERNAGDITVIGSMAGSVLTHGLGAYCVSKAATNTYVEILQEENRNSGVHIMLVCPPMVNTPLLEQAGSTGPASLQLARATDRMATPESIVVAINRGLAQRKKVVRPGEAGIFMWLRRFSPSLVWWIMRKANTA